MKKVLSVLLSFCMIISCLSVCVMAADEITAEEYFSQNGSHEVETLVYESNETDYSYYKVWYPADLKNSNKTYPVILYCNGTGANDKMLATVNLMTAFASWGFIGLTNDHPSTGNGDSASKGLDLLLALNEDSESVFYNKIDTEAIGVCGHSQGGSATINVTSKGRYANSDMFKSICAISAPHSALAASPAQMTPYDASKVEIPAFLIAGTTYDEAGGLLFSGIAPLELSLIANMKAINNDNVVIARFTGAHHNSIQANAQPYIIAWFFYTLLNDEFASTVFIGDEPELYNNSKWQDVHNKQSADLPTDKSLLEKAVDWIADIVTTVIDFLAMLVDIIFDKILN